MAYYVWVQWEGPVVLGSASPRRRQLLAEVFPEFEVLVPDLDEDALTCEDPWQTAERLAQAKAAVIHAKRPDAMVIAGDTVVALPTGDGFELLSKPVDEDDAFRILRALSGKEHLVVTGLCVWSPVEVHVGHETTRVRFRVLGDEEIRTYIATGEPMDKAGAYGIQGLGGTIIEGFDGSLSNVIGLPLDLLRSLVNRRVSST